MQVSHVMYVMCLYRCSLLYVPYVLHVLYVIYVSYLTYVMFVIHVLTYVLCCM